MELKTLVKDMSAIDQGRWVDKTEVPGLGDLRVKMRGSHTESVRKYLADQQRAGVEIGTALGAIIASELLIEVEGLTNGGDTVTADQLRPMLTDASTEPLQFLLLEVMAAVDATRAAKALELSKN